LRYTKSPSHVARNTTDILQGETARLDLCVFLTVSFHSLIIYWHIPRSNTE